VGALVLLLSVDLWRQLWIAHTGGTPRCGFGGEGACAELWDVPAARWVHRETGVPVAGWGAVWGLAATLLCLGTAYRGGEEAVAWRTAVRLHALGGLVAALGLAGLSLAQRTFCPGCAAVYGLALLFTAGALAGLGRPRFPEALSAGWITAAALGLGYLLAVVPGLRTPAAATTVAQEALAEVAGGSGAAGRPEPAVLLADFLASLDPQARQLLADTLLVYRSAEPANLEPPRFLVGDPQAPVRITDFTDPLCPACAELHANLAVFFRTLAPGSFHLEPRHFPLDGRCNPLIPNERDGLRCLAAGAMVCLEGHPQAFELAGRIFAEQGSLTAERVFELVAPALARPQLEACLANDETRERLSADIRAAAALGIEGTPLVLVNRREVPSFAPLLYVLVLTAGEADHPVLASLPAPSDQARAYVETRATRGD
jgi:protein-disulfide isomerase